MASVKKHFSQQINRINQALSQSIGRSEKSEVLTEGLQQADQRVESMIDALKHTRKKLLECLRSKKATSAKDDLEKRRNAFEEYKLSQVIYSEAKEMESSFGAGLLSGVMINYAEVFCGVINEMVNYEINVEQTVVDKLTKFSEEMDNLCQQKDKLKKLVLDMDSAKSRLNAAQSRGDERVSEIQDEYDSAYSKVESCRDAFVGDLYTLAAKEVEMASLYRTLLQAQVDYHRRALSRLEAAEPIIYKKIDTYPRRPVYGCPLEDHLRYTKREIAVVLDTCCSALLELGFKDEGIFRIPGNATKLRKLKALFDAGETDISDCDRDSIAGALKQYLRELPDPIMNGSLYSDWIKTLNFSDTERRLSAVRDVIAKLPVSYYSNLRYLVKFLAKLVENQVHTKMSSQNLAIVMAPNMIWSKSEGDGFGLSTTHGTLVELLVANANLLFPGDLYDASLRGAVSSDSISNSIDGSYTSRHSALSVDVSLPVSRGSPDELIMADRMISPTKGGFRKPKHPAPPPPCLPAASTPPPNVQEQRGMRASFHGLEVDRSAKLVDINISDSNPSDAPGSRGKVGHKKSNSLDRPVRPPLPTSDLRMIPPIEPAAETDLQPTAENGAVKKGAQNTLRLDNNGLIKGTEGTQAPLRLQPLPHPAMAALTAKNAEDEEGRPISTTVRVLPSDDSDDDEPVMSEADFVRRRAGPLDNPARVAHSYYIAASVSGDASRPISAPLPTSPKEVSYVSVTGDGDHCEQQPSAMSRISSGSYKQPSSVSATRPKPPVPTKPRSLESPDKDSIVRL